MIMIKNNAIILRKCDVSSHLNVLGFRLHKLKTQTDILQNIQVSKLFLRSF